MPRVKRLDTTNEQVGQDGVAVLDPVEAKLIAPKIEPVDGPNAMAMVDELAFMEEPVTVTVHTTKEKFEGPLVTISVNGRDQNFLRGQAITVKRKFVEGLARAKPVSFRNEEFVNGEGDKQFRYPASSGLRYPFQVDHDANPRGGPWLRKILAEAN